MRSPLLPLMIASFLALSGTLVHGQDANPQTTTPTQAPAVMPAMVPRVTDGVTNTPVLPSATAAEITEFNSPHWVYLHGGIILQHDAALPADRHELLLYLPGTQPPGAATAAAHSPEPGHLSHHASHTFCLMAASLGYHVIALSYPNAQSASSCNNDTEPSAFEDFRMAIIQGGASKHLTISRADSIENRLIHLLSYLCQHNPQEGWETFLDSAGQIRWETIAVGGQSQGGGHAALIGIHHYVSRVLCFGAPKDYSTALHAPGAWYAEASATPKDRFFAFNHEQDRQGCTPEHQIENLKALHLDQLGAPTLVDGGSAPFGDAHILMTNYPGTKVDSLTAHATMLNPKNKDLFASVWKYMLTR